MCIFTLKHKSGFIFSTCILILVHSQLNKKSNVLSLFFRANNIFTFCLRAPPNILRRRQNYTKDQTISLTHLLCLLSLLIQDRLSVLYSFTHKLHVGFVHGSSTLQEPSSSGKLAQTEELFCEI